MLGGTPQRCGVVICGNALLGRSGHEEGVAWRMRTITVGPPVLVTTTGGRPIARGVILVGLTFCSEVALSGTRTTSVRRVVRVVDGIGSPPVRHSRANSRPSLVG